MIAFLLALESLGALIGNLMLLSVPFLLSDERSTLAERARFAVDAYATTFAEMLRTSPGNVWAEVAVSAVFAITGLIAAWLAWRLHPWGRRAILLVVGLRAIAHAVSLALAGFPGNSIDWENIVWYTAAVSVFLTPAVARLYTRAPEEPSR